MTFDTSCCMGGWGVGVGVGTDEQGRSFLSWSLTYRWYLESWTYPWYLESWTYPWYLESWTYPWYLKSLTYPGYKPLYPLCPRPAAMTLHCRRPWMGTAHTHKHTVYTTLFVTTFSKAIVQTVLSNTENPSFSVLGTTKIKDQRRHAFQDPFCSSVILEQKGF